MSANPISYRKYDTYTDSELPWCPQVPSIWNLIPNKGFLTKKKDVVGSSWDELTLLSLTKQGVIVRDLENLQGKFSSDMSSYQRVKPGNLIFCLFDIEETPRTVGMAHDDGMITGAYAVFRCKNEILAKFVELYYIAMDDKKRLSYMYSGLRNTIRPPIFLSLKTPLPSEVEMDRIIKFLELKIAIIDKLINKKQELIELLQEKRQALITQAVTKGLDPNAKMNDSGVEWIGEIPENWEIRKIKDLFIISRGRVIAKTELDEDGKYPVYSSQTLDDGLLGMINTYDYDVDILTWTTDGALAGTVFKRAGKYSCTNVCGMMIPKYDMHINLDYMLYAVQHSAYENKRPDTNGFKIMSGEMKKIAIAKPPIGVQNQIANKLNNSIRKINLVARKMEQQIIKLHEFKSALIYNAVTGKIKI